MGYGPGPAAGLLAGGYSNSGTLGVASSNIGQLGLDAQQATAQAGLMEVAYAVTLPTEGVLTAWFLASVAPKILRVDLRKVSKELEAKMGIHEEGEQAYQPIVARAYRLANAALVGRTPPELDAGLQGAVATRFRQGAEIVDADVQTAIPQGATLVLSGSPHALFAAKETIGPEVEDNELLAYPAEKLDIVVTNKKAVGRTVGTASPKNWRCSRRCCICSRSTMTPISRPAAGSRLSTMSKLTRKNSCGKASPWPAGLLSRQGL